MTIVYGKYQYIGDGYWPDMDTMVLEIIDLGSSWLFTVRCSTSKSRGSNVDTGHIQQQLQGSLQTRAYSLKRSR